MGYSKYYGMYRGIVTYNTNYDVNGEQRNNNQNTTNGQTDTTPAKTDTTLKGRCKVFVHGVYPIEFLSQPSKLPWAEPAYPIFGGNYDQTGINSVPQEGAHVWIFFEQGDHMTPIYSFGCQGGDGWFSEHSRQHVVKSDNVEIIIDENPSQSPSLSAITSYNADCATGGNVTENIETTVSLSGNGNVNVVINGSANVQINGKSFIEYNGDVHETINGALYRKITGNVTEEIGGEHNETIDGKVTQVYNDEQSITVANELNINSSVTNLESNTNVTGVLDASSDVVAGATNISLVTHTHPYINVTVPATTSPPNP